MPPVLSQMLNQFEQRHARLPARIVVTPLALLLLAVKHSAATTWQGIPVQCRDLDASEAVANDSATGLAVFAQPDGNSARLACFDI